MLVSGAAVALVIVFAVLNTNKVKVDWIVTTGDTALIVVIVSAVPAGRDRRRPVLASPGERLT